MAMLVAEAGAAGGQHDHGSGGPRGHRTRADQGDQRAEGTCFLSSFLE